MKITLLYTSWLSMFGNPYPQSNFKYQPLALRATVALCIFVLEFPYTQAAFTLVKRLRRERGHPNRGLH